MKLVPDHGALTGLGDDEPHTVRFVRMRVSSDGCPCLSENERQQLHEANKLLLTIASSPTVVAEDCRAAIERIARVLSVEHDGWFRRIGKGLPNSRTMPVGEGL